MPSLLSGDIARRLIEELHARPDELRPLCVTGFAKNGIEFADARRCSVNNEASGGLVIKVYGVKCAYAARTHDLRTSLRPGWTDNTIRRAVHRMCDALMIAHHLNVHRDVLFQRVAWVADDPAAEAEVEEASAQNGRPTDYGMMTHEDVAWWQDWFDARAAKKVTP